MTTPAIKSAFLNAGWFTSNGAYVLFDGQYGSTGKGLLASFIAEVAGKGIDMVATNAGPNSGHVGYYKGDMVRTQQLPVASVVMRKLGLNPLIYLNGGAIIDFDILEQEINECLITGDHPAIVYLHPSAAVIKGTHLGMNQNIASTGKGTGPATADKINRKLSAVVQGNMFDIASRDGLYPYLQLIVPKSLHQSRILVETAQGWSLGINSGFYPYTTSRECSVAQAIADMGISPNALKKSIACVRTFPIRVGNVPEGHSGHWYDDQKEISFGQIGQEPELTTVTKRIRRIATWSDTQFKQMLLANRPDALFINFCNYLGDWENFVASKIRVYEDTLHKDPDFVLTGHGPFNEDVRLFETN